MYTYIHTHILLTRAPGAQLRDSAAEARCVLDTAAAAGMGAGLGDSNECYYYYYYYEQQY